MSGELFISKKYKIIKAINKLSPVTPQFYPPCEDCNKKMNEIRKAYDKLQDRPRCLKCGHVVRFYIEPQERSDKE